MDIGVAEYMTNNVYCNLTLVGSHFDDSMLGVVIPKNWLYEQDLDVNILSLRELGELDNLKKHWFQTRNCESPGENPGAMGIASMAGLFLTIGVISVLALLALFWDTTIDDQEVSLDIQRSNLHRLCRRKTSDDKRRFLSAHLGHGSPPNSLLQLLYHFRPSPSTVRKNKF